MTNQKIQITSMAGFQSSLAGIDSTRTTGPTAQPPLATRYCQILWIGEFQATSVPAG